ncbi:MAG: universal stress protein [Marinobacterium sp.]|nr:universal stress protein [Marinobacterium sp.]
MLPEIRTILYASDLGEGSRPAFRLALNEAIRHQAKIVFIHVIEPFEQTMEETIEEYLPEQVSNRHLSQLMSTHKRRVEERIQRFLETEAVDSNSLPQAPEAVVKVGRPDKVILKIAERHNADLIVMGDRANSTLSRIFLGSTAQKVIHRSSVPVLIVPLQKNR